MRVIRATFDGKTFVPDEPVNLPAQSSVTVLVEPDATDWAEYDKAIREYYFSGTDTDDDWPEELQGDFKKAWDED